MKTKQVTVGNVSLGGGDKICLIAGPCVIESEKAALSAAETLIRITADAQFPFVYKSSYDKANRSSLTSYRGPGISEGLRILKKVKDEFHIPVLSDIHKESEIEPAKEVLDIIQIPAFLSRQTDLLIKAAQTGLPVNVKKGQFLAPWDVKNLIEKIVSTGNSKLIITERGSSFGYNNLVSDLRALPIMRGFGVPVVYDATHSLQLPGGAGTSSSGNREFIPNMTRSAVAAGCDGIFMEVHPTPDSAPCDGPNMLAIKDLAPLLNDILAVDEIVKKREQ
ncbi:MAG: 3-deoxy-8-phosphooctulonate synthase [Nitrospinota bacterium]